MSVIIYQCLCYMNKVKNGFAARTFSSPELYFINVAKEPTAGIQINEAYHLDPWINIFQDEYIQS